MEVFMKTFMRYILLLSLMALGSVADAQWMQVGTFTNARTIAAAQGRLLLSRADSGVYVSTNDGTTWEPLSMGLTAPVTAFGSVGSTFLAGTMGRGVFTLQTGSSVWQAADSGLPADILVRGFLTDNNDVYLISYQGLFKSTDMGVSWMSLNEGLGNTSIWYVNVHDDSTITVGTYTGLYRSSHPDSMFVPIGEDVMVFSGATSGNNIFIGTNKGVLASADNGNTWTATGLSLTDSNIFAFASRPNQIFIGSEGSDAVFFSTDGGITWQTVASGMPSTFVNALAISGNTLFAATDQGLFSTAIEPAGVINGIASQHAVLEHAIPNPARARVRFQYYLPQRSSARLVLHDALGRAVATIVEEISDHGWHIIDFDASALTAGSYWYELATEKDKLTRQLILAP
jgi:hypothetical protein